MGVGLREGTGDPEGFPTLSGEGLRDDAIPTRKQLGDFYAKWGVSKNRLPFDESADGPEEVQSGIDRALTENKLLLVQFGANWSPDCLVMSKIMNSDDVKSVLNKSFELVAIDVGRFDKNRKIWHKIAESVESNSFPIPFFWTLKPIGGGKLHLVDGTGWPGGRKATPEKVKEVLSNIVKKAQE